MRARIASTETYDNNSTQDLRMSNRKALLFIPRRYVKCYGDSSLKFCETYFWNLLPREIKGGAHFKKDLNSHGFFFFRIPCDVKGNAKL